MATQDYAASVQGAAIRVTRLDAAGNMKTGDLDSYTTSAFLRMSFTPEYEDGEEITEKAANGTVCVSYKAPDVLKRVTMELAICEPDPELTALLAGGVLLSRDLSNASGLTVTGATISSGTLNLYMTSVTGLSAGDNVTLSGLTPTTGTINGIARVLGIAAGTGSMSAYSKVTIATEATTAASKVISGATVATNVATITTATAHGLVADQFVTLFNLTSASGSVDYKVKAVTDSTNFTIDYTATNGSLTLGTSPTSSAGILITDAEVTKRSDTSVGWAAPLIGDDPAGNGVAIECWSYAVANGKRAATNPFFHWVFPYARLRASGDRVIENGLLANTFEGYGIGNAAFGSGPDGRWEFPGVTDRPYAYARSDYSPSQSLLKGFYTWNTSTGLHTAVSNLPVADVDLDYNVPGGAAYLANTPQDVITNSDED